MLQCTISSALQHFKRIFVHCVIASLDGHGSSGARAAMDPEADTFSDQTPRSRRGLLIVLSSPSGAGKTTISRMLMEADGEVTMSISATTRPKRPGEVEGVDYHFVDDAEFDRLIAAGE